MTTGAVPSVNRAARRLARKVLAVVFVKNSTTIGHHCIYCDGPRTRDGHDTYCPVPAAREVMRLTSRAKP